MPLFPCYDHCLSDGCMPRLPVCTLCNVVVYYAFYLICMHFMPVLSLHYGKKYCNKITTPKTSFTVFGDLDLPATKPTTPVISI